MTTYTSINNALRKGATLMATIETNGQVLSSPVTGVQRGRSRGVLVETTFGWYCVGTLWLGGTQSSTVTVRRINRP